MLKFYHTPYSRSSSIFWLLEELGQPYEMEVLDIRAPGGAPETYRDVQPNKKVPAVDHDGTIVTERAAITIYLADAFPEAGLAPRRRCRPRALSDRLVYCDAVLDPAVAAKAQGLRYGATILVRPVRGYGRDWRGSCPSAATLQAIALRQPIPDRQRDQLHHEHRQGAARAAGFHGLPRPCGRPACLSEGGGARRGTDQDCDAAAAIPAEIGTGRTRSGRLSEQIVGVRAIDLDGDDVAAAQRPARLTWTEPSISGASYLVRPFAGVPAASSMRTGRRLPTFGLELAPPRSSAGAAMKRCQRCLLDLFRHRVEAEIVGAARLRPART